MNVMNEFENILWVGITGSSYIPSIIKIWAGWCDANLYFNLKAKVKSESEDSLLSMLW